MGKNGGEPHDISSLEEAPKSFARKRIENSAVMKSGQGSKVRDVDFSSSIKREEDVAIGLEHPPGLAVSDTRPVLDATKGDSASADIVAMIGGVPPMLEDLEQIAAADQAFRVDFPESSEAPEFPEAETADPAMARELASRDTSRRDFAFGVMGAALLVWVAFLVTRVPIVNEPKIFAKALPTPALRASSLKSAHEPIRERWRRCWRAATPSSARSTIARRRALPT